jgi:hypothetical protein
MVPNTAAKAASAATSPPCRPAADAGCKLKVVNAMAAAAAVAIARLFQVRIGNIRMFALDWFARPIGGSCKSI